MVDLIANTFSFLFKANKALICFPDVFLPFHNMQSQVWSFLTTAISNQLLKAESPPPSQRSQETLLGHRLVT